MSAYDRQLGQAEETRHAAFVLVSTTHGALIINRNDYAAARWGKGPMQCYGVGFQILTASSYETAELACLRRVLDLRRQHYGPCVVAIDCGANIGVHTVEWARLMHGWGRVVAFEAQEWLFYALAGNVALNNCFNASVHHAAVGATCGTILVPQPDYTVPASYGSLELRQRDTTEFIGQSIDYRPDACRSVRMVTLDSLDLDRMDLIKIDVEGMEMDVLRGTEESIAAHHPPLWVETLKTDKDSLDSFLADRRYCRFRFGINTLAIHKDDPVLAEFARSTNEAPPQADE